MAFPWLTENGFETGAIGHFDAFSPDPFTRSQYAHYSALAKVPGLPAPFRGAYCFKVDLATNTTDHYLQETGSWDVALAAAAMSWRFAFFLSKNTVMANANEFAIFQLWSGATTVEVGCYVNYTTANGFRLGIGEATASQFIALSLGEWHFIELTFTPETAGDGTANDASIAGWLDGGAFTTVSTLDVAAITSGVMGVIGQDAGTTAGHVLFDDVIADDARIFPPVRRWPLHRVITQSEHVFVGPGIVDSAELISGVATDNVLTLFDTDTADVNEANCFVLRLNNTANSELVPSGDLSNRQFIRGCYAQLAGTNPRAVVNILRASAYASDGAVREYGAKRKDFVIGRY